MSRYRIGLALQIIGLIYEVFVYIISNYSVGIFMPNNVPTTIMPGAGFYAFFYVAPQSQLLIIHSIGT